MYPWIKLDQTTTKTQIIPLPQFSKSNFMVRKRTRDVMLRSGSACPKKSKPSSSTETDFEDYATKENLRIIRATRKPHLLMGNIEKTAYGDDRREMATYLNSFVENMKLQSHPPAEKLLGLLEKRLVRTNVVRASLIRTAAFLKKRKETRNNDEVVKFLSRQVRAICNYVYYITRGDATKTDRYLKTKKFQGGVHADDVGDFLVLFAKCIYEEGIDRVDDSNLEFMMEAGEKIVNALMDLKRYDEADEHCLENLNVLRKMERQFPTKRVLFLQRKGQCMIETGKCRLAIKTLEEAKDLALKFRFETTKDGQHRLRQIDCHLNSAKRHEMISHPPLTYRY